LVDGTRVSDGADELVLRRAPWFTAMNLALAGGLLALALAALTQDDASIGWTGALVFLAVALFHLWQTIAQIRDARPVVAVTRQGLVLPSAADEVIEWSAIGRVDYRAGAIAGARVDIDIDPAIHARMRMGQRAMGDAIVRRRGVAGGFSILTTGLDRDGAALYAAIRRHWPVE
jgi:hypothetical protein